MGEFGLTSQLLETSASSLIIQFFSKELHILQFLLPIKRLLSATILKEAIFAAC